MYAIDLKNFSFDATLPCVPHRKHPHWYDYSNTYLDKSKIMKLLIMLFFLNPHNVHTLNHCLSLVFVLSNFNQLPLFCL
jgi:hypothetical protein